MAELTLTLEDYKNAISETYQPTVTIEYCGLGLRIKKHLSVEEMMTFVSKVVTTCFASDTGEYMPEIKDFAIRSAILEHYTELELPNELSERYDFVYQSEIVSCVVQHVDASQFDAMIEAINEKVEHLAQSHIKALNKQMSEAVSAFSALEKKISDIFSGIDNKTISNLVSAISNGSFDERKLVQAFKKDMATERHVKDNVVQMPVKDQ